MVYLDAACAAANNALPDLRELCHEKLELYRVGEIDLKEYLAYVKRYKHLRDMLYHAGYLIEDWDDGKV